MRVLDRAYRRPDAEPLLPALPRPVLERPCDSLD